MIFSIQTIRDFRFSFSIGPEISFLSNEKKREVQSRETKSGQKLIRINMETMYIVYVIANFTVINHIYIFNYFHRRSFR